MIFKSILEFYAVYIAEAVKLIIIFFF